MADTKKMEMTESQAGDSGGNEPEFYEEPPRMSALDAIGVFVALLLLGVIGVAGYVWLTPGLSFSTLMPGNRAAPTDGTAQAMAADADAQQNPMPASAAHVKCAQCGMFADNSASHVQASWSDGTVTDHDSWGCVVNYATDHGLILTAARVVGYDSALADDRDPMWLDAQAATYLLNTERVAGSMPPYVAAFSTEQAAVDAREQLGGEVLDFAGLAARLNLESYDFAAAGATPGAAVADAHAEMAMEHSIAEHAHNTDIEMEMDAHEHQDQAASEMEMAADSGRLDPLAAPQTHDHDMSCPTCGMPANASQAEVVVLWSNGDHEHFDSWDCVFARAAEAGLSIVRAVVREYGDMDAEPRWIKAQAAWYLYDVNDITMSMPPFVAAFDSAAAAEVAQAELGGELVSFAGLQAHWE